MLRTLAADLIPTTNMMLEGLLSEIKSAVPKGKQKAGTNAEKLAWLSHLSQLLRAHMSSGRRDCRGPADRSSLIQSGVPLEHRDFTKRRRPDTRWRNVHLSRWRIRGGLGDESDEARRLAAQWAAFSDADRDAAISALDAEGVDGDVDVDVASAANGCEVCGGDGDGPDDWFDMGDQEWPVRPDVLHEFLQKHPAHRSHGVPGIANKACAVRDAERGFLVVSDVAKDDVVYVHRHPCVELHPGLCATRDRAIYDDALKLAKNLETTLDKRFLHRYFCVMGDDVEALRLQGCLWGCLFKWT